MFKLLVIIFHITGGMYVIDVESFHSKVACKEAKKYIETKHKKHGKPQKMFVKCIKDGLTRVK